MNVWEGVADDNDWLLQGRSNGREVAIVGVAEYREGMASVREGVANEGVAEGGAKDIKVVTRGVVSMAPRGDLKVVSEATEGVATYNMGVVTGNMGVADCRDKLRQRGVWERGTGSTGLLSDPVPSEWPPQGSEEEDSVPRSALARVTVGSLVEALLEDELLSVVATSGVILSVGDIVWLL